MIKRTAFLILILVLLLSLSTSVFAAERLGTGHISGGAGILYYIDSSASSYVQSIGYGLERWNGIDSNITIYRTYTQSYSRCDNYWGYYWSPTSVIVAQTVFYVNNAITTDYDNDWYWCKIKYNANKYKIDDPLYTFARRKAIACHEYGHFLGLKHTDLIYLDIMYPLANTMIAEYPCSDEKAMVSSIY